MTTYHEFDHNEKHYKLVYDDVHQTVGSYGYETEAETKAAEDEEIAKLQSGEWVVLGCIVTRACPGLQDEKGQAIQAHCCACSGTEELDSCWGIVVENNTQKAEEFCKEQGW